MSTSDILVSIIGIVTITVVVNDQDRMISLNNTLFFFHNSLSVMNPCKFNYKQEQQGDCRLSAQSCNVQEGQDLGLVSDDHRKTQI